MNEFVTLALSALVGIFLAAPSRDGPPDAAVRIIVQVPPRHQDSDIYLACAANGWNPGDPNWKLAPQSESGPGIYSIAIPKQAIGKEGLAYKFTKGSWESVEVDENLRDVPNRTIDAALLVREPGEPIPVVRVRVPAFADERTGPAVASTVVGRLETFAFFSQTLGNARTIRVWLPERYGSSDGERFPVLYMHDGRNCFDQATTAFGDEWRIDETLTELISAGEVPPMIVVGIDNAGPDRAHEYNASYSTFGDRQPYGEKYVAMLVDELLPEIKRRYRVRTGPEHTSLGGSSFGGNITMLAAMERPGVFGRLLIESPAVPVVGPKFLEEILEFGEANRWTPESDTFTGSVFLAMGTSETADEANNERLVALMEELRTAFASERHRIVVEEGATHNERAWAKRFPDAMRFLFRDSPGP